MMIPGSSPGTNVEDAVAGSEPLSSDPPALLPAARGLPYTDFAAALKEALRDFHSTDLLARNPLLQEGICNLGGSAGPLELRAMLVETVATLFGNPRAAFGCQSRNESPDAPKAVPDKNCVRLAGPRVGAFWRLGDPVWNWRNSRRSRPGAAPQ
jgi:hypothetical protein